MTKLDKQPVPSETTCPFCGGEPEREVEHQLKDLGYKHDDQQRSCSECGNEWQHGVPIGEQWDERAEELFCNSCEDRFMLAHYVNPVPGKDVGVLLKCPSCYLTTDIIRERDESGGFLLGYPQTTGEQEDGSWRTGEDSDKGGDE